MRNPVNSMRWAGFVRLFFGFAGLSLLTVFASLGFQRPEIPGRFDAVAIQDPTTTVIPTALEISSLGLPPSIRSAWSGFRNTNGEDWDIHVDARSGAPTLVQGRGIAFIPGSGNSLQSSDHITLPMLEKLVRDFMGRNADLLLAPDGELVLNAASGQITPDLWQVQFDRVVSGVPVARDGYVFYVGHGNLISFGAIRWSKITTDPNPTLTAGAARAILMTYMGIKPQDTISFEDPDGLLFEPIAAAGTDESDFSGPVGTGYQTALVWRIKMQIAGESGAWIGLVDAHTGTVLGLESDTKNAQAKGGIYPITNDAVCPTGCEQAGFPMPYADITIDGVKGSPTTGMGSFTCSPSGSSATTTLQGPYFKISDTCGSISKAVTCDQDIDMGTSAGTDCTTPGSGGLGNTHSARSAFYHLNRIGEHGRAWLPANAWLNAPLPVNLNVNLTCNANGSGTQLNFYRSGGGCPNSGEIASVFLHEWGHGLDASDGGGFESPSEAYADITSFLVTHQSCIGRGWTAGNCGGYGDACTSCTGIREMDWGKLASNTPRTPSNFPAACAGADNGGVGPCNKGSHCEAYLAGQTFWDLATRDLTAAGIDQQTAWQIVDRIWFISRSGSAGPGYGCGATASQRSCAVTSWMQQIRVLDDEDGNLANGTPHAAAIFAAFNRHQIQCGLASDTTNQSATSCPALVTPVVTATSGTSGSVQLSWPSGGANVRRWNVLRNDQGCNWGQTPIANTSVRTFTDGDLPNGRPIYYVVQPLGLNSSCIGASSACITTFPFQISSNGPICTGGTVNLTASSFAGATYAWTGPNGFSSSAQSPSIAHATAAASGTYTVIVTLGGITSTASTTVSVRDLFQSCDDGNRCTTGDTCLETFSVYLNESFDGASFPGWFADVLPPSPPGTNPWTTATNFFVSSPRSAWTDSPPNVSDKVLISPSFVPGTGSTVRFNNRYNLETNFDGAVLEIKIGGGAFTDIIAAGGTFIRGGYNATIQFTQNPLAGRAAWSGASPGFVDTEVSLPSGAIGQTVQLRWRLATDISAAAGTPNGQWIDDVRVIASGISCVSTGQVVCAADACHSAGVCDAATGICSNPALAEGTPCSDGIDCTGPDTCKSLPAVQNFSSVAAPALPGGWSTTVSAGVLWATTTSLPQVGPPNAVTTDSPTITSDKMLQSPPYHIATGATAVLEFDNWYNLERSTFPDTAFDGAILEIKIGNGAFTNIVAAGGSFVTGGYNATIAGINALNGQQGWGGASPGFVHTKVSLPAAAAGQTVVLRWRMATDGSQAPPAPNGQRIDNVRVSNDYSTCGGATLNPPAEVTTDRFLADKTTYTWNAVPTATTYDIVSGDLPALPVGPGGGDESYNQCGTASTTFGDPYTPPAGFGWFYIVRGRNQTCPGSYGTQAGGAPRTTTTCP